MRLPLRITRSVATLAAIAAIAAVCAVSAARANHFILPCGEICTNAQWGATGSLNVARWGHTATLLQDGRVLVAGGSGDGSRILDSAELYDAATGTWSVTGHLGVPRIVHTATLLPDGKVLVAGGLTTMPPDSSSTETAEIYDPAAGSWSPTGNMSASRVAHTATRLHDGNVLVAGGDGDVVGTAELYDPGSGTWSTTGNLNSPRWGHTMTLLQNGEVLVARGSDQGDIWGPLRSTELYDPLAGSWSMVGDAGPLGSVWHTATPLPDGRVLVTGGYVGGGAGHLVPPEARLFDPATRGWSRTVDLVKPRSGHTATLLDNGDVLVSGGANDFGEIPATERIDPDMATSSAAANLISPRRSHTATRLADGRVLVAGGSVVGPDYSSTPLASAELYGAAVQPRGFELRREPLPILPGRGRTPAGGTIR